MKKIIFLVFVLVAIFLIFGKPILKQIIIGLCLLNLALNIKLHCAFQKHMGWHKGKNSH